MRDREPRSGVNGQGALKQKSVKQTGVIKGLGVPLIKKNCLSLNTSIRIIDKSVVINSDELILMKSNRTVLCGLYLYC
jgi:hypothetical protein